MFWRAVTLLIVWLSIGSVTASACSIFVTSREGEYDYNPIYIHDFPKGVDYESKDVASHVVNAVSGLRFAFWDNSHIFVAKPEFYTIPATTEYLDNAPVGVVRFTVIENILGDNKNEYWFTNDSGQINTVIDPDFFKNNYPDDFKSFLEYTNERAEGHNNFQFWDYLTFVEPEINYSPLMTSCGFTSIPMVDFDRHYLIVNSRHSPFIIPLSGPTDSIVPAFKNAVAKEKKDIRRSISSKEFFSHMKYAEAFKLDSCSDELLESNKSTFWWDPYTVTIDDDFMKDPTLREQVIWKKHIRISPLDVTRTNPELISAVEDNWPSLFEYYGDRDQKGVTCSGNENYLVFGYETVKDSRNMLFRQNKPTSLKSNYGHSALRYAKIVDGNVLISSIQTNYIFDAYTAVPVDQVLEWVNANDDNTDINFSEFLQ